MACGWIVLWDRRLWRQGDLYVACLGTFFEGQGGKYVFKWNFFLKSDLQTRQPPDPPSPADPPRRLSAGSVAVSVALFPAPLEPGGDDIGPGGRGTSRSCDSAPGWGHGFFPFFSLVWGAARRRAEAQTRSGEGRGAVTVQDTHGRRHAEVTRLVEGAGLASPSPGSRPARLQIRTSVWLPRSR